MLVEFSMCALARLFAATRSITAVYSRRITTERQNVSGSYFPWGWLTLHTWAALLPMQPAVQALPWACGASCVYPPDSTELSPSSDAPRDFSIILLKTKASLPCSQGPATSAYPESGESNSYSHISFHLRSILILLFHLLLGFPSGICLHCTGHFTYSSVVVLCCCQLRIGN
jgi:hypothetical protein